MPAEHESPDARELPEQTARRRQDELPGAFVLF